MSTSAQMSWRLPLFSSITTIGELLRSERKTSLTVGAWMRASLDGVLRPGTLTRIGAPGLKPSARLYGRGSIGTPLLLRGISLFTRWTRRPVDVVRSLTVSELLGNGKSVFALAGAADASAQTSPTAKRLRPPLLPTGEINEADRRGPCTARAPRALPARGCAGCTTRRARGRRRRAGRSR